MLKEVTDVGPARQGRQQVAEYRQLTQFPLPRGGGRRPPLPVDAHDAWIRTVPRGPRRPASANLGRFVASRTAAARLLF
jgi:hypothetical protein